MQLAHFSASADIASAAPQTPATQRLRCIVDEISNILHALETSVVECETDSMHDKSKIAEFETQSAKRVVRLRAVQTRKENMRTNRLPSSPRWCSKITEKDPQNCKKKPQLVKDTLDARNEYEMEIKSIFTHNSMARDTELSCDDNAHMSQLQCKEPVYVDRYCTSVVCVRFTNLLCRRVDDSI